MIICSNCGTDNRDGATYCDNCGKILNKDNATTKNTNIETQQPNEQKIFAVLGWLFNILAIIFFPIIFGPLGVFMGFFHKKYHAKHGNIIIISAILCMFIGMILGAISNPGI